MQNEIKDVCPLILSLRRVLNFGTSHVQVEQCREQLIVSCGVSLHSAVQLGIARVPQLM